MSNDVHHSAEYDSNMERRRFLKYLALASGGAMVTNWLPGCNKAKTPKTVRLALYGTGTLDILEDGWQKASTAHVDVRFSDNGNDTGPVIAKMLSGTAARDYQVGGLQGGAERELFEAKAVLPWDLSKIPNWQHVWQMAKNIPYARIGVEQIGLPIALNADSIVYLPDRVKDVSGYEGGVIDSYSAIFDERLRGRTSMEDAWINSVIFAAIYLKENPSIGIAIDTPGDLSEAELKDVMTFLIDHKKRGQFRKFWAGWEQGVDLLASGEVIAMTGWEPIVYELRNNRKINAVYAKPREGYEGWSNDLLLHAGVKSTDAYDAAHRLANWLYGGYYGCKLAAMRGYAVPSDLMLTVAKDSSEFDDSKISTLAEHVKQKFEREGGNTYWQNVRPRNYRLYEEWWAKLRQA